MVTGVVVRASRMTFLIPSLACWTAVGLSSALFFFAKSSISCSMNWTRAGLACTSERANRLENWSRLVIFLLVIVSIPFFSGRSLPLFCNKVSLDYILIITWFLEFVKRFFYFLLYNHVDIGETTATRIIGALFACLYLTAGNHATKKIDNRVSGHIPKSFSVCPLDSYGSSTAGSGRETVPNCLDDRSVAPLGHFSPAGLLHLCRVQLALESGGKVKIIGFVGKVQHTLIHFNLLHNKSLSTVLVVSLIDWGVPSFPSTLYLYYTRGLAICQEVFQTFFFLFFLLVSSFDCIFIIAQSREIVKNFFFTT